MKFVRGITLTRILEEAKEQRRSIPIAGIGLATIAGSRRRSRRRWSWCSRSRS